MRLTDEQLSRIVELLKEYPNTKLVSGVQGLVTCGGYAIEYPGGVIHPLSFLEMMDYGQ